MSIARNHKESVMLEESNELNTHDEALIKAILDKHKLYRNQFTLRFLWGDEESRVEEVFKVYSINSFKGYSISATDLDTIGIVEKLKHIFGGETNEGLFNIIGYTAYSIQNEEMFNIIVSSALGGIYILRSDGTTYNYNDDDSGYEIELNLLDYIEV